MAVELPAVIPKVACTLSELQGILTQKYPFLSTEEGRVLDNSFVFLLWSHEMFKAKPLLSKGKIVVGGND